MRLEVLEDRRLLSIDGPATEAGPLADGEIRGLAWDDLDGDGFRDPGEPGLAEATVFADLDQDGQLDAGEPSATTLDDNLSTPDVDETGTYVLAGLAADTYEIRQIPPAGYTQTSPAEPQDGSGALTYVGLVEEGQDGAGLDGAYAVAFSPDGQYVYVGSQQDDSLCVFRLDSATGELTFLEAFRDDEETVDGLAGVTSVAVSPDGANVYATSGGEHAVAVFGRNPATGLLTYSQTLKHAVDGVEGLYWAQDVTVDPTGDYVYVAGNQSDGGLSVLARSPGSGELTEIQYLCDNVDGVTGISGSKAVVAGPDGRHVYVAASNHDAIVTFEWSDGRLVFVEMDAHALLGDPEAAAISPDGKHIYVASEYNRSLLVYARDDVTGGLTFVEVKEDGVGGVDGLYRVLDVAVSADGSHVYAAGTGEDEIALFSRDPATGQLTFVEVIRDGVGGVDGLDGVASLAVSPLGGHLAAAGRFDDALASLARNTDDQDPAFGKLSPADVVFDGEGGVNGLSVVQAVAVSPDGNHV